MTGDQGAETAKTAVLKLTCADRPGIVAAVARFLFETDCNIVDSAQYGDAVTDTFFLRITVKAVQPTGLDLGRLRARFQSIAETYRMVWSLRASTARPRLLVMVSKFDHCLADLVYRWRIGELQAEIAGVVSNHPHSTSSGIDISGIPFHHIPVTKDTKAAQEQSLLALVASERIDLVVLARYMQVLSDDLAHKLSGRAINIHHSFLPGFKGAKPYHQAHERGVKLIGATAHYVTGDLDEGPIIDQDVERVSHADTPDDLVAKGRDIERRVLARAVTLHLADRVFVNGTRTVVL
jgi:formyltetrahydrofolate deformylase